MNLQGVFTPKYLILRRLYPSGIDDPVGHRSGSRGAGGRDSCYLYLAVVRTALSRPVSSEAGLFWFYNRRWENWSKSVSLSLGISQKNHSHLISIGVVVKRVMGFEPTNGSLGSYCLTTWLHPRDGKYFTMLAYMRVSNKIVWNRCDSCINIAAEIELLGWNLIS